MSDTNLDIISNRLNRAVGILNGGTTGSSGVRVVVLRVSETERGRVKEEGRERERGGRWGVVCGIQTQSVVEHWGRVEDFGVC